MNAFCVFGLSLVFAGTSAGAQESQQPQFPQEQIERGADIDST